MARGGGGRHPKREDVGRIADCLAEPEAYAVESEKYEDGEWDDFFEGDYEPVPDYVFACLLAQSYGKAPWELFGPGEIQPEHWWWRLAMSITSEAKGIAEEARAARIRGDHEAD